MNPIDIIIHLDKYIEIIIKNFGLLSYFILFLIIFLETGLVITPFLPGDSLIFVAGTFAAKKSFNVFILFFLLSIAAILGDTLNYWIGNCLGKTISKSKLVKKEYLEKTRNFYKKYGGKTIIIARFIPIIRTFAPFVAGIGKMFYPKFFVFNIIGGIVWVALFLSAGYFFGNIPLVKENLSIAIMIIIFISILPPVIEYIKHKKSEYRPKLTTQPSLKAF